MTSVLRPRYDMNLTSVYSDIDVVRFTSFVYRCQRVTRPSVTSRSSGHGVHRLPAPRRPGPLVAYYGAIFVWRRLDRCSVASSARDSPRPCMCAPSQLNTPAVAPLDSDAYVYKTPCGKAVTAILIKIAGCYSDWAKEGGGGRIALYMPHSRARTWDSRTSGGSPDGRAWHVIVL